MKRCVTIIILVNFNLVLAIFLPKQIQREQGAKTEEHCDAFLEHMKRVAAANNAEDSKMNNAAVRTRNPDDFKSTSWEDYTSSFELEEKFKFLQWTDYSNNSWVNEGGKELQEDLAAIQTFKEKNYDTNRDPSPNSLSKPKKKPLWKNLVLTNPKASNVLRQYHYYDFDNQDYAKDLKHSILSPVSYKTDMHRLKTGLNKPSDKEYQLEKSFNSLYNNHNNFMNNANKKNVNPQNRNPDFINPDNLDFGVNSFVVNNQDIDKLLDVYFDLLKPIPVWVRREEQAEALLRILKLISSREMQASNQDNRRNILFNNENKNYNTNYKVQNKKVSNVPIDKSMLMSVEKIFEFYNHSDSNKVPYNGKVLKSNIEPEVRGILDIVNNAPATSKSNSVINIFSGEIKKLMSMLLQTPYHDEAIKRGLKTLFDILHRLQNGLNRADKPYKDYNELNQVLTQLKENTEKEKTNIYENVNQFIKFINEKHGNNVWTKSGVILDKLNEVLSQPDQFAYVLKQLNYLISSSLDSQRKVELIYTLDTIIGGILDSVLNNVPEELKKQLPITLLTLLERIKLLPESQNSETQYLQIKQILNPLLELPISNTYLNNIVWLLQEAANEHFTHKKEKNIFDILKDKFSKLLNNNPATLDNNNIRNILHNIIVFISNGKNSQHDQTSINEYIKNIKIQQAIDGNARHIINKIEMYLQNLLNGEHDDNYANYLAELISDYLVSESKNSLKEELIKLIHNVISDNRVKSKNQYLNNILLKVLLMLEQVDENNLISTFDTIRGLQDIIEQVENDPNLDTEISTKLKYVLNQLTYKADDLSKNESNKKNPKESTETPLIDKSTANYENDLMKILILLSNKDILPTDELFITNFLGNLTRNDLDSQIINIMRMIKLYLESSKDIKQDYQREDIMRAIEQYLALNKPIDNPNQNTGTLLIEILHKNRDSSQNRDLNNKLLEAINLLQKYDSGDMEQKNILLKELRELIENAMLITGLQKNIIDELKKTASYFSDPNFRIPDKKIKKVTVDKDVNISNKTLDAYSRAWLVKIIILLTKKELTHTDKVALKNIVNELQNTPNIKDEVKSIILKLGEYLNEYPTGIDMVIVKTIEDYLVNNPIEASQDYASITMLLINTIRLNRNTSKNENLDHILLKSLMELQSFEHTNNKTEEVNLNNLRKLLEYALKLPNLSNDIVNEIMSITEKTQKISIELDIYQPQWHPSSELPIKMPKMQFENKNGTIILEILFKLLHKNNEAGIDNEKINNIINLILAVKNVNIDNQISELLTPLFGYRNLDVLINVQNTRTLEYEDLADIISDIYQIKQAVAEIDQEALDGPFVLRNIIKYFAKALRENKDLTPPIMKNIIYMISDVILYKRGSEVTRSSHYFGTPQLISSLIEVLSSNYSARRRSPSKDVKLLVDVIDTLQHLDDNIPAYSLPPVSGLSATAIMYVKNYLEDALEIEEVKNKTETLTNLIDIVMLVLRNGTLTYINTISLKKQNIVLTLSSVIDSNKDTLDTPEALQQFTQLVEAIDTIIKIQNESPVSRLPPMLGTNQNFIQLLVKLFNDKTYEEHVVRNIVSLVYEKTRDGRVLRKPLLLYKLLTKIFGKDNFATAAPLNVYP